MFLGILTLITALSISAVAIYYSVAGLVAIFAAAALPIMIMGGVLEVSKLVTAVWLHRYWKQATWWLKTYLSVAVFVLMVITSMGIFGFLSKAHIEQTAQSTDNLAQVETIQKEIDRNFAIIDRAENKIMELDNSQANTDTTTQDQIDREQERIDTAYDRVQPLVDEQNKNLQDQILLFGLDKVDTKIAVLNEAMNINTRDRDAVRVLQSMVGAKPDGAYGSGTAAKVEEYRNGLNTERDLILQKIQQARQDTNEEIARIRQGAETQIAESNRLINRLREQLGTQDNAEQIQTAIDEQNNRIKIASTSVDQLTEEKIALESEYRKLEAEVGPIKYIAEFVYGENADNNMLEEAVRWVIITIIFVFDPLAVLLLIASQYTFEWRRKDDDGERLRQYKKTRAQRIVDNPGYNIDDPTPPAEEKEQVDDSNRDDAGGSTESTPLQPTAGADDTRRDTAEGMAVAREGGVADARVDEPTDSNIQDGDVEHNERDRKTNDEEDLSRRSIVEPAEEQVPDSDQAQEQPSAIQDTTTDSQKETPIVKDTRNPFNWEREIEDKKQILNLEQQIREQEYIEKDSKLDTAKTAWKTDHPEETLKHYKNLYINGHIDKLPWEDYTQEGYTQNEEQNSDTLFNKLKK